MEEEKVNNIEEFVVQEFRKIAQKYIDEEKDFHYQELAQGKYGYDEKVYHTESQRIDVLKKIYYGRIEEWDLGILARFLYFCQGPIKIAQKIRQVCMAIYGSLSYKPKNYLKDLKFLFHSIEIEFPFEKEEEIQELKDRNEYKNYIPKRIQDFMFRENEIKEIEKLKEKEYIIINGEEGIGKKQIILKVFPKLKWMSYEYLIDNYKDIKEDSRIVIYNCLYEESIYHSIKIMKELNQKGWIFIIKSLSKNINLFFDNIFYLNPFSIDEITEYFMKRIGLKKDINNDIKKWIRFICFLLKGNLKNLNILISFYNLKLMDLKEMMEYLSNKKDIIKECMLRLYKKDIELFNYFCFYIYHFYIDWNQENIKQINLLIKNNGYEILKSSGILDCLNLDFILILQLFNIYEIIKNINYQSNSYSYFNSKLYPFMNEDYSITFIKIYYSNTFFGSIPYYYHHFYNSNYLYRIQSTINSSIRFQSSSLPFLYFIKDYSNENMTHPLLDNLIQEKGYKIKKNVLGDGNCQFRATANQLDLDDDQFHVPIRHKCVDWLRNNKNTKIGDSELFHFNYEFESWESFCDHMDQDAVWGDHINLIGISNVFNLNIKVISEIENQVDVYPIQGNSDKTIYLFHHVNGKHYISILPKDDLKKETIKDDLKETIKETKVEIKEEIKEETIKETKVEIKEEIKESIKESIKEEIKEEKSLEKVKKKKKNKKKK